MCPNLKESYCISLFVKAIYNVADVISFKRQQLVGYLLSMRKRGGEIYEKLATNQNHTIAIAAKKCQESSQKSDHSLLSLFFLCFTDKSAASTNK